MTSRAKLFTTGVTGLTLGGSAYAADTNSDQPPAAPQAASTAVSQQAPASDEIVVTAQKRQETASTVGMAITAVTGDQLKRQNVTDVAGLSNIDPSFVSRMRRPTPSSETSSTAGI